MSSLIRTYSELKSIPTFEERYHYLRLAGIVGEDTFGFDRWIYQRLLHSSQWKRLRNEIIVRDNGCDLGIPEHDIGGSITIHHMNPVRLDAIMEGSSDIWNPEFLICVSDQTHKAIHYGDESLLPRGPVERRPGDTCPWK